MSATQAPAPMTEGEAGFGAGQTPASPTVPLGEAGPNSSDADAVGALASEGQASAAEHGQERCPRGPVRSAAGGPRWSPVDDERGNLLDLLANEHPEIPSKAEEWGHFRKVLADVAAENGGVIDQNLTRPRLAGAVAPQRVGPMFRRACREGLIRPNSDHTITANSQSGNVGRPARSYDWLDTRGGERHAR